MEEKHLEQIHDFIERYTLGVSFIDLMVKMLSYTHTNLHNDIHFTLFTIRKNFRTNDFY